MTDEMEFPPELVLLFLDEAQEHLNQWEEDCLALTRTLGEKKFSEIFEEKMNNLFRVAHTLKGSSKCVQLNSFGDTVHKIEDVITALKNEKISEVSHALYFLLESQSFLASWIDFLKDQPEIQEIPSHLKNVHERIIKKSSDYFKNSAEVNSKTESAKHPALSETVLEVQKSQSAKKENTKKSETLRVQADKLEELVQLIGELSVMQSVTFEGIKNLQNPPKNLNQSAYSSQKITREIYARILSLRMQPIGWLLQRIERNALETSRLLEKNVKVLVEGSDLEFDKAVLEKLNDPLMHLVRNAIDHGVETPEVRKQYQKSERAQIKLSVRQEATRTIIAIEDDGSGVNVERILKKGIETGVAENGKKYTREEIFEFIFLPGFSTREIVTDTSGRGMGLDVVNQAVRALGGEVKVESETGRGTTFQIFLPISFSIIDGIIVNIDDVSYAVPTRDLSEIINLTEYEHTTPSDAQFMLRNEIVPLVKTSTFLVKSERAEEACRLIQSLKEPEIKKKLTRPGLVVRRDGFTVVFEVDSIQSQSQLVVSQLSDRMNAEGLYQGSSLLPNGEPAFILNVAFLTQSFKNSYSNWRKSS